MNNSNLVFSHNTGPTSIVFSDTLAIHSNGMISVGKGYTPSEAANSFLKVLKECFPQFIESCINDSKKSN